MSWRSKFLSGAVFLWLVMFGGIGVFTLVDILHWPSQLAFGTYIASLAIFSAAALQFHSTLAICALSLSWIGVGIVFFGLIHFLHLYGAGYDDASLSDIIYLLPPTSRRHFCIALVYTGLLYFMLAHIRPVVRRAFGLPVHGVSEDKEISKTFFAANLQQEVSSANVFLLKLLLVLAVIAALLALFFGWQM